MSQSMAHNQKGPATLKMFILDVMRHDDVEQVTSIVKMLNDKGCIGWREFWPQDFCESEVLAALKELHREGLVQCLQEAGDQDRLDPVSPNEVDLAREHGRLWFALTPAGRRRWESWEAPVSAADA